jgi:hypothetical protein
MTDSDSSASSTSSSEFFLNLRTRKVPKVEADPDRRCTTVPGWPKRPAVKNMEHNEPHEKGAEASPGDFCREMQARRAIQPTAPSSKLLDDHYEQQVRNLEELLEQERQEARNYIDEVKEWNAQEMDEKQKVIEALERTIIRMKLAQEVDDESDEQTHECKEVGAPLSASTPKQVDVMDQPRAPTTEPQQRGSEAELAELLLKRRVKSEERKPPEAADLQALTVLAGTTSEGTHRQVTFRRQSDDSDNATVEQEEQAMPTVEPEEPKERGRRLKSPKIARRQRSASSEFQKPADKVLVPCDLMLQALAVEGKTRAISDAAVAPKPFTGKSSQDPEAWLEYFERYCDFRRLVPADRLNLFGIMLHEGAADWFSTLPAEQKTQYTDLVKAFKANYYKSAELKWREAGQLWNQAQGAEERVEDYVTRLRKAARRLELPPEVLHYAVINGLRGPIRLHVVQQGVKSLDDTIRAAKVAEAAASTTPDVMPMMMLDAMKATAQASEKQAAELKQLAARVATLSAAAVAAAVPVEPIMAITGQPQGQGRALRPTPQNQQRQAYAQRAANRTDGGPRSFAPTNQQPQQQSQRPACGRCGWSHQPGNCRADGQLCRSCGKAGHFARVCRSARAPPRD